MFSSQVPYHKRSVRHMFHNYGVHKLSIKVQAFGPELRLRPAFCQDALTSIEE